MIFELEDETTIVSSAAENLPKVLETKILDAVDVEAVGIKSVRIAPVVLSEAGKDISCSQTDAIKCE
jgi:hypothetical protein